MIVFGRFLYFQHYSNFFACDTLWTILLLLFLIRHFPSCSWVFNFFLYFAMLFDVMFDWIFLVVHHLKRIFLVQNSAFEKLQYLSLLKKAIVSNPMRLLY